MTGGRKRKRRNYGKRVTRKEAAKIAKQVVFRQAELKFKDSVPFNTTVDYNGSVQGLGSIAQGDAFNQRIGDELTLSHIELRANIIAGDTTNVVRLVMIQWKQDSAAATLLPTHLILNVANSYAPLSPLQHHDKQKYTVLMDKTINVNTTGEDGVVVIRKRIKPKVKKIKYAQGATTGFNLPYLLAISDSAAATHPTVVAVTRLWYRDE